MAAILPEAIVALPGAAATAVAWRSRGQLNITVIAKASFALAPDADMQRVEPQPILRADVHHQKHPARSIQRTSDLAPYLARADVVFTGHAHAPPGGPVRLLPVRLAVFDRERPLVDKTLLVQAPAGFERIPLMYERAYGGLGYPDNPYGTGAVGDSAEPNVVDPVQPQSVAGFAPFGRAWPVRKQLLGATARKFLDAEIAQIPDDFNWAYYQTAPVDQRTDHLRGDEWIVLEGLQPALPCLRTRLPRARGLARVYGLGAFGVGEGQSLELLADTLRIDGDEGRCTVVWRRSFPVPAEEAIASARIVAGVEVSGVALSWPEARASRTSVAPPPPRAPEPQAAPKPGAAPEPIGSRTISLEEDWEIVSEEPVTLAIGAARRPPAEHPLGGTMEVIASSSRAEPAPLPFVKGAAAIAPAPAPRPEAFDPGKTMPEAFDDDPGVRTLPFVTAEPARAPLARPVSTPPPPLPSVAVAPPPAPHDPRAIPIVHQTPFAIAAVPSGRAPQHPSVTVLVAARCDLAPDGPAKLRPQADLPAGDLAGGKKARADITLVGHAHAPSPGARRGEVSFRFGHQDNAFERQLAVFGERRWQKRGKALPTITEPAPFDRIALEHRHAYGGAGYAPNPEGLGHDLPARTCDKALLPSVEDPEHLIRSLAHEPEPACLAPVPLAFREAADRDQAAPRPQQLELLAGDEPFHITGVRPRRAAIRGRLPGVRARCFVRFRSGSRGFEEVPLQLDTAAFDTDAMTLDLVFRGTLPVEDEGAPGNTIASLFIMMESLSGERTTLEQARVRLEGR